MTQTPPSHPDFLSACGPARPRVRLMGMPIDPVTQLEVIGYILGALAAGRGGWVITPNLDQLRQYHVVPALRAMYEEAELVLADGMPLLWASALQRTPLPQRVAGSELIYSLTAAANAAGRSIFLLGGNPGAADRAADELKRLNPGLKVAGTLCPEFGFERDPAQLRAIVDATAAAHPDIVYVGLGFPKQEHLIQQLRTALPGAWFLGVGISFSFVCGDIKRAPLWMQRAGLEWAHRMVQEPSRLFRRYVLNDMPFAVRLFASATGKR